MKRLRRIPVDPTPGVPTYQRILGIGVLVGALTLGGFAPSSVPVIGADKAEAHSGHLLSPVGARHAVGGGYYERVTQITNRWHCWFGRASVIRVEYWDGDSWVGVRTFGRCW